MSYITKSDLIRGLYAAVGKDCSGEVTDTALAQGWIERQDIDEAGTEITRLDAARITHMFLMKEVGIPDLTDINAASVLRDLYDCRICVNHIAQVYLRGLIAAREIEGISEQRFLIFDGREKLTATEAEYIYRGIRCKKEE